ncbi:MAG TPA: hypothetical protein PLS49_03840 [Candidatus Woesebacteria bacterium]|nr:hypothetical protein [Candidatus Woesebacteria bacterium]
MAQNITIPKKVLEDLINRVKRLEDIVLEKEEEQFTWNQLRKDSEEALEEYRKGEYYELHSKEELDDFFKNIVAEVPNEKYYSKNRKKS